MKLNRFDTFNESDNPLNDAKKTTYSAADKKILTADIVQSVTSLVNGDAKNNKIVGISAVDDTTIKVELSFEVVTLKINKIESK